MPPPLPNDLLASLEGLPGYDAVAFAAVHAAAEQAVGHTAGGNTTGAAPTSIRINPAKPPSTMPETTTPVPWSSTGSYLDKRPSFTLDPLFHAGTYYVQEASSMFLEQALKQTVDLSTAKKVLDCCAAPGGKSTLLQSFLSPDSLLVSNEVIRNRVHILQENMIKWGSANTIVTNNDPRDFARLENYFDVIVVDAPCSGSGLFRRDPEAVDEWSPNNVQLCWQRQQRILADCWPALCKDGILIYSTCSYSREEDEDVLDWLMTDFDATSCRLQVNPEWNIVETTSKNNGYGYRFYPHRLKGEGLFIACVRKNDGGTFTPPRRANMPEKPAKKDMESLHSWIKPEAPLAFFIHQQQVHALPESRLADLSILQSACYLKEAGITLGQPSAKDFIPHHHLAMSTMINPAIPTLALSREQALTYLRKEDIKAETTQRGWTLVQYEDANLGWIKVLPQRSNNYYPKEWRILKENKKPHLCPNRTFTKLNAMRSPLTVLFLIGCFFSRLAYSQTTSNELTVHGQTGKLFLEHTVVAKENWYSVGRLYNVSPKELAPFNHLALTQALAIGQVLQVPLTAVNFSQNMQKASAETLVPLYHVTQEKEWMYRISVNHNKVPIPTLEKWNNMNKDAVRPGMHLIVGYLKVKTALSALATEAHLPPATAAKQSVVSPTETTATSAATTTPATTSATTPPAVTTATTTAATTTQPVKPQSVTTATPIVAKANDTPMTRQTVATNNPAAPPAPHFDGGIFKAEFLDNGKSINGTAGIFKSTSGWQDGKYYALMNNVPIGSIVKVTDGTGKIVYVKVLGQLPEMKESLGLTIRISNAAAAEISQPAERFNVQVSY